MEKWFTIVTLNDESALVVTILCSIGIRTLAAKNAFDFFHGQKIPAVFSEFHRRQRVGKTSSRSLRENLRLGESELSFRDADLFFPFTNECSKL